MHVVPSTYTNPESPKGRRRKSPASYYVLDRRTWKLSFRIKYLFISHPFAVITILAIVLQLAYMGVVINSKEYRQSKAIIALQFM